MMNDDFHSADNLDAFVDAYRHDPTVPPPPESQFAADLIDLTGTLEPDPDFAAQLAQRLHIQPGHLTPDRRSMNGKLSHEEHLMLMPKPVQQPPTRIPWTLAAALVAVLSAIFQAAGGYLIVLVCWPRVREKPGK